MAQPMDPGIPMGPTLARSRGPVQAPECGDFGHRNKRGKPCGQFVVGGTDACYFHAGKPLAEHRAAGAVVKEVRRWGLGDTSVDPGEVLLRLVSQSATRAEMYAQALGEAYDAAERLRVAHAARELIAVRPEGDEDEPPEAAEQAAYQDLARIFNTGGIAALVGYTFSATNTGSIFATGEAIRGLAKLEAEERDRCANFAAKAVAAGLAERQVRIAERMGAQMAAVFGRVLAALSLTPEQAALVPSVVSREISAAMTIEGSLA